MQTFSILLRPDFFFSKLLVLFPVGQLEKHLLGKLLTKGGWEVLAQIDNFSIINQSKYV